MRDLTDAGFEITTKEWIEDYDRRYRQARQDWKEAILTCQKELEQKGGLNAFFEAYSTHQFAMPAGAPVYKTEADVAVYCVARVAGENADRFAAAGDYALSDTEREQLKTLGNLYEHVVVLINAGGVVDLAFLEELPHMQAALVISQPGMEGGHAVADVLSGAVNPSGKLTDT